MNQYRIWFVSVHISGKSMKYMINVKFGIMATVSGERSGDLEMLTGGFNCVWCSSFLPWVGSAGCLLYYFTYLSGCLKFTSTLRRNPRTEFIYSVNSESGGWGSWTNEWQGKNIETNRSPAHDLYKRSIANNHTHHHGEYGIYNVH